MPTFLQLCRKARQNRFKYWKKRALQSSPQRIGTCIRVYRSPPKKPCSAQRPIGRVKLRSRYTIFCHFRGIENPTTLRKFSVVIVHGGRPADLPAVKYRAIRGAKGRKLNFRSLEGLGRTTRRSIYAIKRLKRLAKIRYERFTKKKRWEKWSDI